MEPTIEAGKDPEGGARQPLGPVVQIDEGRIQAHLDEVVRSTVEETLNALLDAEADELCGARKYERTEGRKDTRAGSYDRRLQTKAGEVTLTVPKLRNLPFETCFGSGSPLTTVNPEVGVSQITVTSQSATIQPEPAIWLLAGYGLLSPIESYFRIARNPPGTRKIESPPMRISNAC
jgi:hypothetical protein